MSHIVTVKTEIKNEQALRQACSKLGMTMLPFGKHKLYAGEQEGVAIQLPEWRYPVVVDLKTGEVKYDNYHESWGPQIKLDSLFQSYLAAAVTQDAHLQGYTTEENELEDGTLRLQLTAYE